ncbi:MAG: efflux RND transporter permease subunit [Thermoplasmatota archaeon]
MANPFAALSAWSSSHPWAAILIALVAVGGAGAGMSQAEEGRINELFVPDDLPALAVQRDIEEIWGETEGSFFLYIDDDPTDPALLRAVADDGETLLELDGVLGVASLAQVLEARMGDLDQVPDPQLRSAAQQAITSGQADAFAASDALLMRVTLERVDDIPATVADLEAIRDASAAVPLGTDVRAAGILFIEDYQNNSAGGDVGFLMPLSLVAVIVLLGALFRRFQDVAVPLITVLLAIVMAYGTVAWAGMALAPPSFIVMPLLLGLGIDYMLHIVYAYREQPQDKPVPERFRGASGHVGYPVFFTAATTLIGFGSFLASNIPQIRTWGLLIGSGALYAFILGFLLLPALYKLRRKKPRVTRLPLDGAMNGLTDRIMRHRVPVLILVLVATAGLGTAAAFVSVEDSIEFEPDEDVPVIMDFNEIQDRFGGQNIASFLIDAGDRDDLEILERSFEFHPLVGFVDGPIHRLERAGTPDGPLVGPATEGVATQEHWLVTVGYRYDDREAALAGVEAIAEASPLTAGLTGVDVMERESQAVFLDSLFKSTAIALVLVVLLLLVVFRHPVAAGLAFAPLVITVVWQLGVQTLVDIPINPITGVMTAMIIGVGVDYSLHIMAHFQEERAKGRTSRDAADAAMRSVGRPVLAASITTVFAFSVLGFSSLVPLRHFGIVAAIVVTCAFIVSLTLLPVLASFVPDRLGVPKRARNPAPEDAPARPATPAASVVAVAAVAEPAPKPEPATPRRLFSEGIRPRFVDPDVEREWQVERGL